jgi:H+-translocating NAD(P) transhydrogenase subunit alpha
MRLGVPKERAPGEARVAVTPDVVPKLAGLGFEIVVQAGAGLAAGFSDDAYRAAGAAIVEGPPTDVAVVARIRAPTAQPDGPHEADGLAPGTRVVSLVDPGRKPDLVADLAARGLTVLALDQIPRITRAQSMDVLSSMANIAGYRAIVEAASHFGGFFGPQITAAGKAPPAKVLVIGAGVAGLAALGAARSLGAEVRAFDVRAAAREQVESMGATFLQVEIDESGEGEGGYAKEVSPAFIAAEMALFKAQAAECDVIVTTALIPGRPAPTLLLAEAVHAMKPGGVVVDLAAANGGNCELTVPGQDIVVNGVTIIGATDLPSRLPRVASQFFANNVFRFLEECGGAGFAIDHDNEILRATLVLEDGASRWPAPRRPAPPPQAAPRATPAAPAPAPTAARKARKAHGHGHSAPAGERGPGVWLVLLGVALVLTAATWFAPPGLLAHLTVFVLAVFVGWQVIWSVTPALHTPLMSVTNAISGIILVGGILQAGTGRLDLATALGAVAVLVASVNVVGGFWVTLRMLRMFRTE